MNSIPTLLMYMEYGQLLTTYCNAFDTITFEEGKRALILDRTLFYPQGDGQPYDQGTIQTIDGSALFLVEEVRLMDDKVYQQRDGHCWYI